MTRSGRRTHFILAALFALAAGGCTRNAILELELELPEQPAGPPLFAVVSAQTGVGFEQRWEEATSVPIPLPAACVRARELSCDDRVIDPDCSAVVSIVGDGEEAGELFVRVRFCTDPRCEASGDVSAPEHRVRLERAFYLGRYTGARSCIEELPTTSNPAPHEIERCAVRCREGSGAHHCRDDGSHFCEVE